MKLAKKSLLRKLGTKNKNEGAAALENALYEKINALGIGPMGLGGKTTCLAVHVETAHRHPASLPVGLVVQCWADRRATMIIDAKGNAKFEN
jgi:fumarate hydratase subunit alpha